MVGYNFSFTSILLIGKNYFKIELKIQKIGWEWHGGWCGLMWA